MNFLKKFKQTPLVCFPPLPLFFRQELFKVQVCSSQLASNHPKSRGNATEVQFINLLGYI